MENVIIEFVKGEAIDIPFKVIEKISGDPYSLAEKVLTAVVKGCPTNVAVPTDDIEVVSAVLGKGILHLTAAQSAALKKGVTSWELVIADDESEDSPKKIVQFLNVLDVRDRV